MEKLSLQTISEEDISQINVDGEETLDVAFLLKLIEHIMHTAANEKYQNGGMEFKDVDSSFKSSLYKLKKISCQLMECNIEGEVKTISQRTAAIAKLLSNYSWDAKAVLSVAALAFEFEEFCRLHHHITGSISLTTSTLSKEYWNSVAILKMVRAPTDGQSENKEAFVELKDLVVDILKVTRSIFELEKLRTKYRSISTDIDSQGGLTVIRRKVVCWTIATVVACATQISMFKSVDGQPHDLSEWSPHLIKIQKELQEYRLIFEQEKEKEVHENLSKILDGSDTGSQITEFLNLLIQGETSVEVKHSILIKGSSTTTKRKSIDMLRMKNVLLLISNLDISHDDTLALNSIYQEIKNEKNYQIVWIPIVEEWTTEQYKLFGDLQVRMPWYVLDLDPVSPIAGIKFIKNKWNFTAGKTMVVSMNSRGKVENHNALHMIRLLGRDAFPFTVESERTTLRKEKNWLRLVTKNTHPNIETWMNEEKYIFLYGGTDQKWIKKFGECLENVDFRKFSDHREGNNAKRINVAEAEQNVGFKVERFWTLIESLYSIKVGEDNSRDEIGKALGKLLSYKKADRWVVLSKGPSVIIFDHGTLFLRALKKLVKDSKGNESFIGHNFKTQIKHYHEEMVNQQKIQSVNIETRTIYM